MSEDENGSGSNGHGNGAGVAGLADAPPGIRDLADACVAFVRRSVGIALDYEAETLSLLDHYLTEARAAAKDKPETQRVLCHTAGAYFGEVVRRRHRCWWAAAGDDPFDYELQFEEVYLAIAPVRMMLDALTRTEAADEGGDTGLELDEADREVAATRLAELPEVPAEEFYAPTTRLEVIDIVVEALKTHRMAQHEPLLHLGPSDYEG